MKRIPRVRGKTCIPLSATRALIFAYDFRLRKATVAADDDFDDAFPIALLPCSFFAAFLILSRLTAFARLRRAPLTVPEKGGPAWTEVTSPHFVLTTDAGPEKARAMADDFEKVHAALAFVTQRPSGASRGRLEVVVFDRQEDFFEITGRRPGSGGYFTTQPPTSGERFDGPSEHLVARTIDEIPLFARAGVPIATQAFTRRMATSPTSELTVRCYPGEDGSTGTSELHEDDGSSTAYLRGEFATTTLTCARRGDDNTVSISPTTGTFQGQLATRSYVIEISATQSATSASVDQVSKTFTYTASDATHRVKVDARSITASTSVTLRAALVDPAELRRRAFAARVGLDASSGTLESMLATAWSNASGDAEKLSVLAATGSGTWRFISRLINVIGVLEPIS